MTDEEERLHLLRGIIAGMPEEDQTRVNAIAGIFRNAFRDDGDHAEMAFALVGAELAAQP